MGIGDRLRKVWLGRVPVLGVALLTVASLAPQSGVSAATLKTLYRFCQQGGTNCTDGSVPEAGLITDTAGHLYGTTMGGGAHARGTVFELSPNAAKTIWTERVLYRFCAQGSTNCTDGASPQGLIMDAAGHLYGTSVGGGAHPVFGLGGGTVFELTPNAAKTIWTERVLYSFCALATCTDGRGPLAGLIMDAAGHLYGTTFYDGAHVTPSNEGGTVFELTPTQPRLSGRIRCCTAFACRAAQTAPTARTLGPG